MTTDEVMASKRQFYLFPLEGVVFFPQTSKPLNIFEPRYVKMINDALLTDTPIVLAKADTLHGPGESSSYGRARSGVLGHIRSVAGAGKVRLLERRSDETMLILLEGEGKVHLERVLPREEPYYTVIGTWLDEETTLKNENVFLLNRVVKELSKWLSIHVPDANQRESFLEQLLTPEEKINTLCALMINDPDVQQELLEIDDINERLQEICFYLFESVPTVWSS